MLDYLLYYSVNVLALAASKTLGSGKKKKSSVKREPLTPLSNSEKMKVKKLQIKKNWLFWIRFYANHNIVLSEKLKM